jgi:polyisoprenoid-binding protein YceI
MKTIKSILLLAIILTASAFSTPTTERKEVKEGTIIWKGKKIIGSHTGAIDLTDGYLEMDGDAIVGGIFNVDMTSLIVTDLEGGSKEKLEGHLKSDDFFGVVNHPTATLSIKSATKQANSYEVIGDFTIKGKTQEVTFGLEMGESSARASVKIDRTKFGIQYGSGSFSDKLADNTISDKFELDVIMKF